MTIRIVLPHELFYKPACFRECIPHFASFDSSHSPKGYNVTAQGCLPKALRAITKRGMHPASAVLPLPSLAQAVLQCFNNEAVAVIGRLGIDPLEVGVMAILEV